MQNVILEIMGGEIQCVVESVMSVRNLHQCCEMLLPAAILCGKGSFDFEKVLQLKKTVFTLIDNILAALNQREHIGGISTIWTKQLIL
jgi:hypothetical protein